MTETLEQIVERTGTLTAAAKELGVHRSTVARRLMREKYLGNTCGLEVLRIKENIDSEGNIKQQSVELGGQSMAAESGDVDSALNGLVPEGWELKSAKVHVGADGSMRQAWPAIQRKLPTPIELREAFEKELRDIQLPTVYPSSRLDTAPDILTTVLVGDPHFGQLSWAREVGENYDLTIATKLHIDSMQRLLDKAVLGKKGLLVFMGDNQHNDDPTNRTPSSGHNLDVDGRPRKIQGVLTAAVAAMVELSLRYFEEVSVVILPGNHDGYSAGWLHEVITAYFRQEKRVNVIGDGRYLVAVEFGDVMLGLHHGHQTPLARMGEVMSADYPEMWGRTKIRIGLQGHKHTKEVVERSGFYAETVNTLTAPDNYAHTHPFRSRRSIELKNFHKNEGWHSTFVEAIVRRTDLESWKLG